MNDTFYKEKIDMKMNSQFLFKNIGVKRTEVIRPRLMSAYPSKFIVGGFF